MASTGNPNPNPQPGPFDVHNLFRANPNPNSPPPSTYPPPIHPQYINPYPPPSSPQQQPNHGARLMALLGSAPTTNLEPPANVSKLPKGRRLSGDHVVYDVDIKNQGEVKPQLEVTPITKYSSDPGLVLGRQIAVNKTYICYGLKMGNIRRVTDMILFAEEVHLFASAGIDGRVFVWRINEGPDMEGKPQIMAKVVTAIQMVGEGEPVHPRLCWHSHKQGEEGDGINTEVVDIGKEVGKEMPDVVVKGTSVFDYMEARKIENCNMGVYSEESREFEDWDKEDEELVKIWEDRKALPLAVLRPHDGLPVNSATFLTAPHSPEHIILVTAGPLNREVKLWASASEEGWLLHSDAESWKCTQTLDLESSAESRAEDAFFNQVVALPGAGLILLANAKKNAIYAVHIEYGPYPAATRMDYIAGFTVTMPILSLTGTSNSLPDGNNIVQVYCIQTQAIQQYALDLSQCLPLPLDNMGFEKGDSSAHHTFEKSSSNDSTILEASQGSASTEMPVGSVSFKQHAVNSLHDLSRTEIRQNILPLAVSDSDCTRTASPSFPLSPKLSGMSSDYITSSNSFESSSPQGIFVVDQAVVDGREEANSTNFSKGPSFDDNSRMVPNASILFKQPTHLITPSEILSMAAPSSENTRDLKGGEAKSQDLAVNNDVESVEVEVKVVGETRTCQHDELESQRESDIPVPGKEKLFYSQASDLNMEMVRECCALSDETHPMEVSKTDNSGVTEVFARPSNAGEEEVPDSSKDVPAKISESVLMVVAAQVPLPGAKAKKQKGKCSQVFGSSSNTSSPFNSVDSSNEPGNSTSTPSAEVIISHILVVQEMQNQLMTLQKEMPKQMSAIVATSVTKEGKRVEAALGRNMEKAMKAHSDALWARLQEDNTKHEKLERERTPQITSSITNCMNKELPAILERTLKKELATVGQAVARLVNPVVEKSISSVITESFQYIFLDSSVFVMQKGVGDKAVNNLEKSVNSKLEATVARQIQVQFQTSGKQALQDALKSSLEASVIPAFETSCKTMFEQVDSAFKNGMVEHTITAHQQLDSAQSSLALTLREAINSASSITRSLSGELADGQRKLLALATVGANSKSVNPLATQLSNGPLGSLHEMVEVPLDPTKELSRMISERKFEEAFTGALQRSDVSIVSWLCSQVDLQGILSMVPLPLSQGVLLALLQQLACDISKETNVKVKWMTEVAVAINPADPMIAMHIRPIFDQVYQILGHHRSLPTTAASGQASNIRLLMHVINSVLMSCK
ncbi:hypothetical protein IFM89_009414 [Coptis chinensis]|uniref:Enhancer of mRNA-decapping protein 4 C-terminal domain-containing protein n=1 Tax=Coptis chinensis TaxID=261450 RepID=A0A835LE28_9MAGN|nr:hypothetical protein IFM89_009414 [Coptis chinensis]